MIDMVEQLAKENPVMPKGCIMDLVKMYQQMTPEQRDRFDEEMDNLEEHPMEKLIDDELDNTSVLRFSSAKEADEYLMKEGKLTENENEDEAYE